MTPQNLRALRAVASGDAYGDTIALRSRRSCLVLLEADGLIVQTKPDVFKDCYRLTEAGVATLSDIDEAKLRAEDRPTQKEEP